ncbi:hypothetical protein BSL78_11792 [Apostichopus japonicus]|uniref:Uncharacterized protein n=1 Tax=Stichopus japonicus TaxID=307972 RepID=A0A2G8KTN0_STIJA|nr:hypothetical protein BSL78_11792 [Apostichopus japonicus]
MNIVDLSLSTEDAENGIFQTKADIEPRGNLSSHSSKLSRGFVVPASLVMSDNTEELPGTVSDLLKRNPCYQADTYSCKATLTNSESSRVTKSISELHLNVSAAEEVTESGTYSEPSPLIWSEHSQHPSDFDQTLSFKNDKDNDVVDHLSVKQTLQKNPCYSSNVQNSASSFTEQLDPEENGLGLSVHSPYSTIEEEDIDHSNELLYEDPNPNPEQLDEALKNPSVDCCTSNESEKDHL